ncbi:MAG: hypothetical protein RMM98_17850 [Acidobacteriota bacterium]|nr:hypothetical protein [Acidobacteriota bacterium]
METGRAEVTASELEQTDRLIVIYWTLASPGLRQTLEQLRRDLRDPLIHAQMGIRISRR